MEKYIPDMDFDIMFADEYIGHIKIENEKIVEYSQKDLNKHENYKRFIPMCPLTIGMLAELLEMRCWDRNRANIRDILKALGLKEYNPFKIVMKTHGVDYDDKLWFRFKGETITWKDVDPKREELYV